MISFSSCCLASAGHWPGSCGLTISCHVDLFLSEDILPGVRSCISRPDVSTPVSLIANGFSCPRSRLPSAISILAAVGITNALTGVATTRYSSPGLIGSAYTSLVENCECSISLDSSGCASISSPAVIRSIT